MADEPVETTVTPDEPAAAEDTTQLSLEDATSTTAGAGSPSPAPADSTPTEPQLFAGRFKSAEEAYWHTQGELNALRSQPAAKTTSTTETPKFSTDQLWSLRAQKLQELAAAQASGQAQQAGTLAANINWIDNEIQQQNMGKLKNELMGQNAVQTLMQEGTELLKPYQADLVPGTPLYQETGRIFSMAKHALQSGLDTDQILLGLCTLAAAAKTGKAQAGAQQEARAEFAGALKQSLKQAVVTGAGKAVKPPDTAPDFSKMTDQQFDEYRRKIGVVS